MKQMVVTNQPRTSFGATAAWYEGGGCWGISDWCWGETGFCFWFGFCGLGLSWYLWSAISLIHGQFYHKGFWLTGLYAQVLLEEKSKVYQQFHFSKTILNSFIHSCYFYGASSSPLLLRGAPDTARILCRSFTPKRHRQLRVKDLPNVPTWWMSRISVLTAYKVK